MSEYLTAFNKINKCTVTLHNGAEIDFTKDLDLPVSVEYVLDETLDSASCVLSDLRQQDYKGVDVSKPFEPFTKVVFSFVGQDEEEAVSMFVSHDDVLTKRKDEAWKSYTHKLQLIEQTKLLERFPVDTLTFLNPIPRDYDENAAAEWTYVGE
jgi:hypothetical protein